MTHFMIISKVLFFAVIQNCFYNFIKIFVNQFAVCYVHYIISAAFFVEPQCQRAVFVLVAKRKFHLVSVSELLGAAFDPVKNIIRISIRIHLAAFCQCSLDQCTHLRTFHIQLVFVGYGLVHAAAAGWKNAADRLSYFQRRLFQHFQKSAFHASAALFIYDKPDLLTRYSIFYCDYVIVNTNSPLIRKINFLNHTLQDITFFHLCMLFLSPKFLFFPENKHSIYVHSAGGSNPPLIIVICSPGKAVSIHFSKILPTIYYDSSPGQSLYSACFDFISSNFIFKKIAPVLLPYRSHS